MPVLEELKNRLTEDPCRWLVTGGAGFIGSHLVERLLKWNQEVVCLDDFSSGSQKNLDAILQGLPEDQADRFSIVEGSVADMGICETAIQGVDYVLHQAGLRSVPRSIEDPAEAHRRNVTGSLYVFLAARDAGVRRVVHASSAAVYGNQPRQPKEEGMARNPLSPYAASKSMAEDYATVFAQCYGNEFVGLRYFNVFGPRQDSTSTYSAVIPNWVRSMFRGEAVYINGDGSTTRDFIYIDDVVQANLLAATAPSLVEPARVFNVALGGQTSLNDLFEAIRGSVRKVQPGLEVSDPVYRDFRPGESRHTRGADTRIRTELGFDPEYTIPRGLDEAIQWYRDHPVWPG